MLAGVQMSLKSRSAALFLLAAKLDIKPVISSGALGTLWEPRHTIRLSVCPQNKCLASPAFAVLVIFDKKVGPRLKNTAVQ